MLFESKKNWSKEQLITCVLCGSNNCNENKTYSGMLDLNGKIDAWVMECKKCGFKFLFPSVVELDDLYSKSYFTGVKEDLRQSLVPPSGLSYNTFALERLPKFSASLDLLLKYAPQAITILDVGAATGEFLNIAKRKGLSVKGVEFSKFAAQKAYERYGFEFFVGEFDDFKTDDKFDIIHLNHVLEHFADPQKTVGKIENILSAKGVVYIEVPFQFNWIERLKYYFFQHKLAFNIHSIHHPVFFDPNTLVTLFGLHGFKTVSLKVFDANRYPVKTITHLIKRTIWELAAYLKQGLFIEAIFSRKY